MQINMVAPFIFVLESLVADELKKMDAQNVTAENGRVFFRRRKYIGKGKYTFKVFPSVFT